MSKKERLEALGCRFVPSNIAELLVMVPSIDYTIERTNKHIESITYDTETIQIGDRYSCNVSGYNIDYKVNNISMTDKYPKTFKLLESITNTSTLFVTPLIFENKEMASYLQVINNVYVGYLVNLFVDCDFIQAKDRYSVFMLLKFSKSSRFKAQEEYFLSHPQYLNKYDVSENYVVYEFTIPQKYRNDFDLMMDGKYSMLCSEVINMIVRWHGTSVEATILHGVLNRPREFVAEYERRFGICMDGLELYKKMDNSDVLSRDLL